MKKKLLLTLLPLVSLVGCTSNQVFVPYLDYEGGLPVIHRDNSGHTTYLMLSHFGTIEGYEGVTTKGDVSDKFLEETAVLVAEAGVALPNASQVKSSVSGVTFRGWAYYDESNDNVWPDYYTTVPAVSGLALKAIFDGTSSSGGGGGGGGGGGEVTTITWEAKNMPEWVTNDGCVIFAWAWQQNVEGKWYSLTYSDKTTATFSAPSNLVGMLLARCAPNTVTPNWDETEDVPGRVYNKTDDVEVESGTVSYPFPNSIWKEYTK